MTAGFWLMPTLYEQVGSAESGAPVIAGRWARPPWWYCVGAALAALGGIAIAAALMVELILDPQMGDAPRRWILVAWLAAIGAAWMSILMVRRSLWLFRMRERLGLLAPANELAAQIGVDVKRLARAAKQHKIQPAYRINGVDYYDRADFADAAMLLRPAGEPQSALLRPAASTDRAPEQLLRAANGTDEE